MAERQLEAAYYYMSRRNYIGAINRFQAVATRFPSSSVVDEALFGLMKAYLTLGILSEGKAATAVVCTENLNPGVVVMESA
jgi:outer membrane protein assembly factor BamD